MNDTDMIEVQVRVLNATDTGWLITQGKTYESHWLDKSEVEIPDYGAIKPTVTARMSRAYADRKGVRHG